MTPAVVLSRNARAVRRAVRTIKRAFDAERDTEKLARELVDVRNSDLVCTGQFLQDIGYFHAKHVQRRACLACGLKLNINHRSDAKFCDERCRQRVHRQQETAKGRKSRIVPVAATVNAAKNGNLEVTP